MLTANDTSRRHALSSLAASALALIGLSAAGDASAAKKAHSAAKKKKAKQGPPGLQGPQGPQGPPGTGTGTLTIERGSEFNFEVNANGAPPSVAATSQCFGNGVAVSGMITMANNAGCTVTNSQQVTSPNGWTMTVTCVGTASSDNHLTALCVHS
jgi:hypothetical protein